MGKIGIMGGTFDPIHYGHLMLGEQAYREYGLDEIWYMPSGQPPHKKNHQVTDPAKRLAMTELAIKNHGEFICSDFEVKEAGNTYTANTLKLLCERYPQHTFYFIIGADSLFEIEKWYEPEQVMAYAILLVARREYKTERSMNQQIVNLVSRYHADIRMLHCDEMDISSEKIRQMVSKDQSIAEYVPQEVISYIHTYGLYQEIIYE